MTPRNIPLHTHTHTHIHTHTQLPSRSRQFAYKKTLVARQLQQTHTHIMYMQGSMHTDYKHEHNEV